MICELGSKLSVTMAICTTFYKPSEIWAFQASILMGLTDVMNHVTLEKWTSGLTTQL